jgi:hypothetical protein
MVTWGGFPLEVAGRALPLPYALLEQLPGFSSLSLLYRLATVSGLMLAVLADGARARWAVLVLAEVALVSPARHLPAVTPLPPLPAAATLATLEPGALVNLPIASGRSYLFQQTVHRHPLAGSLNAGANRAALRLLAEARRAARGAGTVEAVVDEARTSGIRYVAVHRHRLVDESFVTAARQIKATFPMVAEDEEMAVYRIW